VENLDIYLGSPKSYSILMVLNNLHRGVISRRTDNHKLVNHINQLVCGIYHLGFYDEPYYNLLCSSWDEVKNEGVNRSSRQEALTLLLKFSQIFLNSFITSHRKMSGAPQLFFRMGVDLPTVHSSTNELFTIYSNPQVLLQILVQNIHGLRINLNLSYFNITKLINALTTSSNSTNFVSREIIVQGVVVLGELRGLAKLGVNTESKEFWLKISSLVELIENE